jgi:hypothetical protein
MSATCPGSALPPGKGPPVPTGQEAGRVPEPFWTQRLEEKSFHICSGSNLLAGRPVRSQDTILTELPGSQDLHTDMDLFEFTIRKK